MSPELVTRDAANLFTGDYIGPSNFALEAVTLFILHQIEVISWFA